ncbi:MAG: site-specific integrase, partial [Blautia sp.]|nr:site-specific integrase [Blautia sp.]
AGKQGCQGDRGINGASAPFMPRKPLDNRRAERAFAIPALAQQTGTVAHNFRAACTKSSEYTKTNPKRRTFTLDEQKLFMDYVHQFSEFYENLYVFLLNTGLRIGEAGALKWSDINFEENCVLVNKTLLYYEKELDELDSKGNPKKKRTLEISDTTKTPNGMRTVYFSSEISAILKNQRKRQLELRMKCGEKWRGTGEFENLVFTTSVGSPVGRYIAERDMKRICKMINRFEDVEFESASPHTFRRTYATRCFEADMQPKVVQALLGHANLAETMDIYTTVMEQKKMEEVKKKSVLQL